MSRKSIVDLVADESTDLVLKYLKLFKQEVLELKLREGIQKREYYQGMIDGLILFGKIIEPSTTEEKERSP